MVCVFCGAETDSSNGAEEYLVEYGIVDEHNKTQIIKEYLVCKNCVARVTRKCEQCGKSYTLTKDQLLLIKNGAFILLYQCLDCINKGVGELNGK
jgi:hypothetical protein